MGTEANIDIPSFRSRLSFMPLYAAWKVVAENSTGLPAKICTKLISRFSAFPELLQPIDDFDLLIKHQTLIDAAMMSVFPISLQSDNQAFAAIVPFSFKVIYSSSLFKKLSTDQKADSIQTFSHQIEKNVAKAYVHLAYMLILKKYYNIQLDGASHFICAYPAPEEGIYNYFELQWDVQYVEIASLIELPPLPPNYFTDCNHVDDIGKCNDLFTLLPLNKFVFDGITIIFLNEVTQRETLINIQNIVEKDRPLEGDEIWQQVQQEVRYLLHHPKLNVGFASFFNVPSNMLMFENAKASLLQKGEWSKDDMVSISLLLKQVLSKHPFYLWHQDKPYDASVKELDALFEKGRWQSMLFVRLEIEGKLIGWMELFGENDQSVADVNFVVKLKPVIKTLQQAIHTKWLTLQNKADKLVKEHYTAVQPSVEWKFKSTVLDFIRAQEANGNAYMQPILFENVYPLYGALDIKNSSVERNKAVQHDLADQLQQVNAIIVEAEQHLAVPLLHAVRLKIEEYITNLSGYLTSSNEQAIRTFLREEVIDILRNIKMVIPHMTKEVDHYFKIAKSKIETFNLQQQKFEQSVSMINTQTVQFIEQQQAMAQKVFPFYFERFVTDGVEFNIYIGQSIAPEIKFSKLYLKNLKLWQLSTLARAAKNCQILKSDLEIPLHTTQLILSYNEAISISFRSAERKFDIAGVQNVRFEIIKKRIDKVHIKGTNERLTKEGTIAIVYSAPSEAKEYMQYIKYLKKEKLLSGEVEKLELEDLQGINGLKALRIKVLEEELLEEQKKGVLKKFKVE